jgi:excisionase family DNA binding protein
MQDLLTSRQVQDILKVDRITVYRMLQDGRLKGVKIGQQWRFPQTEVERLLSTPAALAVSASPGGDATFPTHCIQTVQDLFSDVSQIGALVVDSQGEAVTEPSRLCVFCRLIQSTPQGLAACRASWGDFTRRAGSQMYFTCHSGLQYIAAPVLDQAEQVGYFLAGQFYWQQPDPREQAARLGQVAQNCDLNAAQLQSAAASVQVIPAEEHARVEAWPFTAARAVQSILTERKAMVGRLQQIATLTQM